MNFDILCELSNINVVEVH